MNGLGKNPNVLISKSWRETTLTQTHPSESERVILDTSKLDLKQSNTTTTAPPPYTSALEISDLRILDLHPWPYHGILRH